MNPDSSTVIVASGSCAVLCLMISLSVVVLYQKDLLCCRLVPYRTQEYTNDSPYYNSRHSLIGIAHNGHSAALNPGAIRSQHPGTLFIIGKPEDYQLTGPQPRSPSYESVRKKDRQRQIHSMIAQRFGLSGSPDEPPPTYEQTFYPTLQASPSNVRSLGVQSSIHTCDQSPRSGEEEHDTAARRSSSRTSPSFRISSP